MCRDNELCKSEYILSIFIFVANFTYADATPQQAITIPVEQSNALILSPVPFVGVLMFRPEPNASVAVAGLILIHPKIAIVNANDLAKIKKFFPKDFETVTNVMFLSADNQPWFAAVTSISIHPEYNANTMATIGTVYLTYDDNNYKGPMLRWPDGNNNVSYAGDEIFVFGYTDRTESLEQIVYRMDYISFIDCYNFYVDEELNSQWMQPASYHCYKVRFNSEPCVFDPGMALVHHFNGTWTLLGMSSWGPGCALPARFLDFEYFIPWIAGKIIARRAVENITKWQDYFVDEEGPLAREHWPDLDTWILNRLNDSAITLTAVKDPAKPESVVGKCISNTMMDKQLIYRDRMNFTSLHKGTKAVGVYGLSLYDLRYNKTRFTCISVIAYCKKKSVAKLFYTKDFEQNHLFEDFIMTKPITFKKIPPRVYTFLKMPWSAFVDTLPSDVTTLMFRFEYEDQGYLEVGFYGNQSWHYDPKYMRHNVSSTTFKPPSTPVWINVGHRTPYKRIRTTTPAGRRRKTTRTPSKTTTNWWSKWWKYQSYPKVPGEDGGDVDWYKG